MYASNASDRCGPFVGDNPRETPSNGSPIDVTSNVNRSRVYFFTKYSSKSKKHVKEKHKTGKYL
jgi:hypothetical protein